MLGQRGNRMTAEQRINRAFAGWLTEAVIDPSKTADFEQLKQYLIGEMEEAVKGEHERLAQLSDRLGAFYKIAEPNPEPPGGEIVSYHDFADAIRASAS